MSIDEEPTCYWTCVTPAGDALTFSACASNTQTTAADPTGLSCPHCGGLIVLVSDVVAGVLPFTKRETAPSALVCEQSTPENPCGPVWIVDGDDTPMCRRCFEASADA